MLGRIFSLFFVVVVGITAQEPKTPQSSRSDELERSARVLTPSDLPTLEAKAKEGDIRAQVVLALAYDHGYGTKVDYLDTARWAQSAAERGDAVAQDLLGKLFFLGQGVNRDITKAVEWFRKSADQGLDEGQYDLGVTYMQGSGVQQDYAEAMKWFERAADQGHANAAFNLGAGYFQGRGVPKDGKKAGDLIMFAAAKGNTAAMELLETLALNLNPPDYKNAYKWLLTALYFGSQNQDKVHDLESKLTKEELDTAKASARSWTNLVRATPAHVKTISEMVEKPAPAPDVIAKEWRPDKYKLPGDKRFEIWDIKPEMLSGKTLIKFRLKAKGFKVGPTYTVWILRLTGSQPEPISRGLYVDYQGKMACWLHSNKPVGSVRWCENRTLEDTVFALQGFRRGEPLMIGLIAGDLSEKAFALADPQPIEATDGPCHLNAQLASPRGDSFVLLGKGFKPDDEIEWRANSEGEVLEGKVSAAPSGNFVIALAPGVVGKQSGTVTVVTTAKSCKVTLSFPWGLGAVQAQ